MVPIFDKPKLPSNLYYLLISVLDSMAMPPSGMMTVHISALGEYDQCLGIRSPVLENGRRIYGQYCQMEARSIIPKTKTSTRYAETVFLDNTYIRQALEFVRSQMKMNNFLDEEAYLVRMMKEMLDWIDKDVCFFHVGLCVPASCSPQELEMVINQSEQNPFLVRVVFCNTELTSIDPA